MGRLIAGLLLGVSAACSALAQQSDSSQAPAVSPLTDAEELDIRDQIERNWSLGGLAEASDLENVVIELRVFLGPNGRVIDVKTINDRPDIPSFRKAADSARRAVWISSPLKLPAGKSFETLRLRFYPGEWAN
jgi:hypothetical protein